MEGFWRSKWNLFASELCTSSTITTSDLTVEQLVTRYDETLKRLLDTHASTKQVTCRKRPSDPWHDAECRSTRNTTRKLERHYKKTKTANDRSVRISALHRMHRMMEKKRSSYWKSKIDSSNDPKDLWRSIKSVLEGNNATAPDSGKSLSADDLAAFFCKKKFDDIRASTNGAAPASFLKAGINCHLPVFDPVTVDELIRIIRSAPTK